MPEQPRIIKIEKEESAGGEWRVKYEPEWRKSGERIRIRHTCGEDWVTESSHIWLNVHATDELDAYRKVSDLFRRYPND